MIKLLQIDFFLGFDCFIDLVTPTLAFVSNGYVVKARIFGLAFSRWNNLCILSLLIFCLSRTGDCCHCTEHFLFDNWRYGWPEVEGGYVRYICKGDVTMMNMKEAKHLHMR